MAAAFRGIFFFEDHPRSTPDRAEIVFQVWERKRLKHPSGLLFWGFLPSRWRGRRDPGGKMTTQEGHGLDEVDVGHVNQRWGCPTTEAWRRRGQTAGSSPRGAHGHLHANHSQLAWDWLATVRLWRDTMDETGNLLRAEKTCPGGAEWEGKLAPNQPR